MQGILGAIYVFAGTFDQLTDSVIFAAWIFYLFTMLACFPLRRRHRDRGDVYLAPGYPVLPLCFVLFALAFLVYSFWDSADLARRWYLASPKDLADPKNKGIADGVYLIVSALIILAGIPAYWLVRFTRKRKRQAPGA